MIRSSILFDILSPLQSLTDPAHPISEQDDRPAKRDILPPGSASQALSDTPSCFPDLSLVIYYLYQFSGLRPAFFIFELSSSNLHSFVIVSTPSHVVIKEIFLSFFFVLSHSTRYLFIVMLQCPFVHFNQGKIPTRKSEKSKLLESFLSIQETFFKDSSLIVNDKKSQAGSKTLQQRGPRLRPWRSCLKRGRNARKAKEKIGQNQC